APRRGWGGAPRRELGARLEHRHRPAEPVEVVAHGPEVVDRLGLAHDVELAALVDQQVYVARRLEAAAEPALRLAHPLGHRPNLAVPAGEQDDDAVGLTQLVGPQHDPTVVVQAHQSTLASTSPT